ncbi:MAG: hypothetical protein R3C56_35745 [Pirellulaceae bacterium]
MDWICGLSPSADGERQRMRSHFKVKWSVRTADTSTKFTYSTYPTISRVLVTDHSKAPRRLAHVLPSVSFSGD